MVRTAVYTFVYAHVLLAGDYVYLYTLMSVNILKVGTTNVFMITCQWLNGIVLHVLVHSN